MMTRENISQEKIEEFKKIVVKFIESRGMHVKDVTIDFAMTKDL